MGRVGVFCNAGMEMEVSPEAAVEAEVEPDPQQAWGVARVNFP